jgi:arsenical pump membrane protein
VIKDRLVFRAAFPVLAILLAAYFLLAPRGVPVSAVTGGGAFVLLALAGRWHAGGRGAVLHVGDVLRGAPWQIVIFSLGMYLVVYGLRDAGLTALVAKALGWLAGHGIWAATIGTGFGAALLSSVMNNLPGVLVGTLAVQQVQSVPALTRELMIYANIIGCDLGPKFTPIGSLATLLWLNVLGRQGIVIGWGQYMRIGLIITPPVLLIVLVALVLWLPILGAA